MSDFTEVAERVWVTRHPWCDVSITAIGSDRGLLVVDTHGSSEAARDLIAGLRRLGAGEVHAIVNTHAHFDHWFGNHAFRQAYGPVPIHAHEDAVAEARAADQAAVQADAEGDPAMAQAAATPLVMADHTFSSVHHLDLGDRYVELVHPGRGHTSGDLVVRIPDVDVLVAGDLVEESAPPAYGMDSYPLEWPTTLDLVLGLMTTATTVVPGHGAVVDREFVEDQRSAIGVVAETIRDLASRRVPLEEALRTGEWPFPEASLQHAVARGYAHLPQVRRQLPLV